MREEINNIITNFVNILGFDGKYYSNVNKSYILYANIPYDGKFFSAGSDDLKYLLTRLKYDIDTKKKIFSDGLILINKKYKDKSLDEQAMITLIHETLHANRMILTNGFNSRSKEINPVIFDGRFVETSSSDKSQYLDPSQEILKGSIDNSKNAVNSMTSLNKEELEDRSFYDTNYHKKMDLQRNIDEALIECMAIVAYQSYSNNNSNLMEIIKDINERLASEDIKAITNIILRHNDLELFKWMIDPLEYQIYDIHYDYFSHYIDEEDMDDLKILENFSFVDDDEIDKSILASRRI